MVYCQERFFWFLVRPLVQQNFENVFSGYEQITVFWYAGAVSPETLEKTVRCLGCLLIS
jgi:hypothetical protein